MYVGVTQRANLIARDRLRVSRHKPLCDSTVAPSLNHEYASLRRLPRRCAALLGGLMLVLGHDCDLSAAQSSAATSQFVDRVGIEELGEQARGGDISAQNELGLAYHLGRGVAQDHSEALRWYRLAAEGGLATAQHNLALLLDEGLGVQRDLVRALHWYTRAAESGLAASQNNLAVMYDQGLGVEEDPREAFKWYSRAAEQGLAVAQDNLGRFCLLYTSPSPRDATLSRMPSSA